MRAAPARSLALVLALFHAAPSSAACDRAGFRVVLDVGHSPEAPGAISAHGIEEYRFNLRLAAVIEAHLLGRGFAGTQRMLTEGGRENLALRAAKANGLRPDLILSVHHDSVQKTYLRNWTVDGAEQAYSDRFKGWSLFVSRGNGHPRESAAFARLLADRLLATGLPFTTHHTEAIRGENRRFLDASRGIYRYDDLAVLKATTAPAVLMESGIIVNRDEEVQLSGSARQNRIAGAVTEAVEAFCASGGD